MPGVCPRGGGGMLKFRVDRRIMGWGLGDFHHSHFKMAPTEKPWGNLEITLGACGFLVCTNQLFNVSLAQNILFSTHIAHARLQAFDGSMGY